VQREYAIRNPMNFVGIANIVGDLPHATGPVG
jgi:hypothetical protein